MQLVCLLNVVGETLVFALRWCYQKFSESGTCSPDHIRRKSGRSRSFRSDTTWPNLLSRYYVPLNLHMSKANCVIHHCHTYSTGLLKIIQCAVPNGLIAFSIATISVGPPDDIVKQHTWIFYSDQWPACNYKCNYNAHSNIFVCHFLFLCAVERGSCFMVVCLDMILSVVKPLEED